MASDPQTTNPNHQLRETGRHRLRTTRLGFSEKNNNVPMLSKTAWLVVGVRFNFISTSWSISENRRFSLFVGAHHWRGGGGGKHKGWFHVLMPKGGRFTNLEKFLHVLGRFEEETMNLADLKKPSSEQVDGHLQKGLTQGAKTSVSERVKTSVNKKPWIDPTILDRPNVHAYQT